MFNRIAFCLLASVAIGCGSVSPADLDETQQAAASRPLYRSWNSGMVDHMYSTVLDQGAPYYVREGILGYCEPAPTSNGTVATVLLHRLYSHTYSDHFYTTDASEAQGAINSGLYREEFVMPDCWVWPVQVPNTCRVYRMFQGAMWGGGNNAGDHFYTTDGNEAEGLLKQSPRRYQPESDHAWFMVQGTGSCAPLPGPYYF